MSMLRKFASSRASTPEGAGEAENAAVFASLRQLKHDHEVLLKEKKNMELYCQEVEADIHSKDESIQSLSREVINARRVIEERERQLEEERITARRLQFEASTSTPEKKKRSLPKLPGHAVLEKQHADETVAAASAESSDDHHVRRLQEHIVKLENALDESREAIRQHTTTLEGGSLADQSGDHESPEVVSLRDELVLACRTMDNETVLDLARRFHQKSEELTEAREVEELLRDENARLAEENLVLRDGYEAAELERNEFEAKSLKLADDLDEALGYLDALREAESTTQQSQALLSVEEEHRAEGQIRDLRARLDVKEKELKEFETTAKESEIRMQELRQQVQDVVALNQVSSLEKSTLESSLESERARREAIVRDLDALRGDLEESTRLKGQIEGTLRDAEVRADELAEQTRAQQAQLDSAKAREIELEKRVASMTSSVSEVNERASEKLEAANNRAAAAESELTTRLAEITASHSKTVAQLQEQLNDAVKSRAETQTDLLAAQKKAGRNSRARSAAEDETLRLRSEVKSLQHELDSERGQLGKLKSQHEIVTQAQQVASTRVETLEKSKLALEQEIQRLKERVKAAEDQETTLKAKIVKMDENLQETATREAQAIDAVHKQRATETASLKADIASMTSQLNSTFEERDRLKAKLVKAETALDSLQTQHSTVSTDRAQEVATLNQQWQETSRALEEKSSKLSEVDAKNTRLTAEVSRLQSRAAVAERRIEQLKSSLLGAEQQREMTLASLRSSQDEAGEAIAAEIKRLKDMVDKSRDDFNTIEIVTGQMSGSKDLAEASGSLAGSVGAAKGTLHEVSLSTCRLDAMMLKLFDEHRAEVNGLTQKSVSLGQEQARLLADKSEADAKRLKQEGAVAEKTQEVAALTRKLEESATQASEQSSQIENLNSTRQRLEERLSRAEKDLAVARREANQAQESVAQMEESVEAVGRDLGRKLTSLATAEARIAQLEEEREALAAETAQLSRGLEDKEGVQIAADTAVAQVTEYQEQLKSMEEVLLEKHQEITRIKESVSFTEVSLAKEKEECDRLRRVVLESSTSKDDEVKSLHDALDAKQKTLDKCAHEVEDLRNDIVTAHSERDSALERLRIVEGQCQKFEDEATARGSKATIAASEVERLKKLLAIATDSEKKQLDLVTALHTDLSEKEKARELAAGKLNHLQAFMEQRETQHKKTVSRVIERADAEIKKFKAQAAQLQTALEEVGRKLTDKPDLERQFVSANDLAEVLETALGMSKSVPVTIRAADPIVVQIDAVCARMEYAHQLVKLLSSKKEGTNHSAATARASAVLRPRTQSVTNTTPASAGPATNKVVDSSQSANGEDGDTSAVDRLLSAVKKFYVAKNSESQAQHGSEAGATFSPCEHNDESLDDPSVLAPKRALTDTEQEKLFQDWCRLKGKVKGVVKQLVAAKAAVAFLRYQDEQTKVYARNRDRLLQQLIAKLGGKRKTKLDLLKILSETSV